jgi:hypothetical protein
MAPSALATLDELGSLTVAAQVSKTYVVLALVQDAASNGTFLAWSWRRSATASPCVSVGH